MTLRVAHVIDSLEYGGTESQCVALVRGLAARGVDNRVVHFRPGPLRQALDGPGIVVERLECHGFARWSFGRLLRELARDLRAHRADVVQTYGFYSNVPGMLAGRLAGVPVLVASRRGHATALTPAQRRVDRLVRRLAHATVVNAEALRTSLVAEEDARSVTVIPNCVVERGPVATPHDPVVGMVANLRLPKDHGTFLRAASLVAERVPTAEFHLVGAGPEEPGLRALVRDLGLGSRVTFLGALAPDDVWVAINRFAVAVLASHSEGLPNAILEAMLAARPVVATAVGGVGEVVEHGVSGYVVPPRDPAALGAAIAALLKDPARAARMGTAGRANVLARYGLGRMVDEYLALWAAVRAGRPTEVPSP